jgi:hypothetical protein
MDPIDRSYHGYYDVERQQLHRRIVKEHLRHAHGGPPYRAIFLAGPMGVGKGHTLRRWEAEGKIRLSDFVWNDPDHFKTLVPETSAFEASDPESAATLVHRESTYLSELVFWETLAMGASTIVEGTLKDAGWYITFFQRLRTLYPHYRIEILHVTAPWEVIQARAARRATATGRHVPLSVILDAYERVPGAVAVLRPLVDVYQHVDNSTDASR